MDPFLNESLRNQSNASDSVKEASMGEVSASDITSKNFTPRTALEEQYEEMKQSLSVKRLISPGGFEGSVSARPSLISDNQGLSASKRINFDEMNNEVNDQSYILDDSRILLQPGAALVEAQGFDHYAEEGREAVTVSGIAPGIQTEGSEAEEG